jgi:Mg-chelatase subunit ChlI
MGLILMVFFGRALEERVEVMKRTKESSKVPKGMRRQIECALKAMGRRSVGGRQRVVQLKKDLDVG